MRKLIFIIAAIIVFILLLVVYLFLSNLRQTPSQEIPISPFPTKAPTPQIPSLSPTTPAPLYNEDLPLLEQAIGRLPVSTQEYDIEYLASTSTFVITIKESPYEENRARAEQWFLDNGFFNIDELNILYSKYRWVQ